MVLICISFLPACRSSETDDRKANGAEKQPPEEVLIDQINEPDKEVENLEASSHLNNNSSQQLSAPVTSPLGIGIGGGLPAGYELEWHHNWSAGQFTQGDNPVPVNNLALNRIGMLAGGPIPLSFPEQVEFDGRRITFNRAHISLPRKDSSNKYIYPGHIKLFCKDPPHLCFLDLALCKDRSTSATEIANCERGTTFTHGKKMLPGCANAADPKLKVRNSVGAYVQYIPPACTNEELRAFVEPFLKLIENHADGRIWQIFNEPDDYEQSWLSPSGAAQVYNYLYPRAKAIDPNARLLCCGTHPGLSLHDPLLRSWMANFVNNLKVPLDGFHYHNYYSQDGWENTAKIIETMNHFSQEVQNVNPTNRVSPPLLAPKKVNYGLYSGIQKYGDLPILITEWSALRRIKENQLVVGDLFRCNPDGLTFDQGGFICDPNSGQYEQCQNNLQTVVPDNLTKSCVLLTTGS